MKIKIDPKTNAPTFEPEEQDIHDARDIELMMDSPGWKKLQEYYKMGREQILQKGKRSGRKIDKDLWALLEGWDECSILPESILERAYKYKETLENKEGEYDGTRETGTED